MNSEWKQSPVGFLYYTRPDRRNAVHMFVLIKRSSHVVILSFGKIAG